MIAYPLSVAEQRRADRVSMLVPIWGEEGSAIEGSRFVRGYCDACGTPMRRQQYVDDDDDMKFMTLLCERCRANIHPGHNIIVSACDTSGSWDNAVRVTEEY